ncbi:MAG: hypothetical protein AAGL89_16070, partial [Pseudomonadota bacterium]
MEQFVDPMREQLEGFELDDIVELFTVDATPIGGARFSWAPTSVEAPDGSFVAPVFGGVTHRVVPFESDGWEHSAGGTLPRPKIRFMLSREDGETLSDASHLLALLNTFDDLLGLQVART